jgi:SAM-dependent methyltransferase
MLQLDAQTMVELFRLQGPSLGLWRAAEIAALRQCSYSAPVLDLGCGDGLVTSFVLPRVEVGVDPEPEPLLRAARTGIYGRLEQAFVEQANLPDGEFGTVLSNSVLEHIPDLRPVLGRVHRLLRPGGRLVFTVPTECFSGYLTLPLAGYQRWRNRSLQHLNLWSEDRWRRQLEAAGFEIERVVPYLRRPLVLAWDGLELIQQPRLGRVRLFGLFWRRLPVRVLKHLAGQAAQLDLSSPAPGGGRLVIAGR